MLEMLSEFRQTETASVERRMFIDGALRGPGEEYAGLPLRVAFDRWAAGGGLVTMQAPHGEVWIEFAGADFLCLIRFLLEEGLAEATGMALGERALAEEREAQQPASSDEEDASSDEEDAAEEEEVATSDVPFPLPRLVAGSCDRAMLEDPDWLRAMHHGHDLCVADIAQLCDVSPGMVRTRLGRFRIEAVSHRGRRSRIDAPSYTGQ